MTSINTTADLVAAGLIDDERSEDELDDQLADDEMGLGGALLQIPLSRFLYDDDDLAQDRFDRACYDPPHID